MRACCVGLAVSRISRFIGTPSLHGGIVPRLPPTSKRKKLFEKRWTTRSSPSMAQQPRSTTAERLRARRKQAGMANAPAHTSEAQVKSKMAELWSDAASKMSPRDVDEAWARLLEETLTPDKREALDRSYAAERNPLMRYNMLLEFSSYLRQVLNTHAPASLVNLPLLLLCDPDRAASSAGCRTPGGSRRGQWCGPGGRRHQPDMGDRARSDHRGVGAHASARHKRSPRASLGADPRVVYRSAGIVARAWSRLPLGPTGRQRGPERAVSLFWAKGQCCPRNLAVCRVSCVRLNGMAKGAQPSASPGHAKLELAHITTRAACSQNTSSKSVNSKHASIDK